MSDKKTGLELMREPFPDHQVSKMCRSTKKDNPKKACSKCGGYHGHPSIQLDYVGHAALTDRLLDADPAWTWEPPSEDELKRLPPAGNNGMWIKLTVCGVSRFGYGDAGDAQWKSEGDAMKERIGDALRNAAMRFGAALELWHKGVLWVDESGPAQETAKASPNGPVSATREIFEALSDEDKDKAAELADYVSSHFRDGDEMGGYEGYVAEPNNDIRAGAFTFLDSKIRSRLKEIARLEREGTQA